MRITLSLLVLVVGCGDVADPVALDGGDADADLTDAAPADAGPAPSVGEVLECGTAAEAGGLASGTDLQRVDLDLTAFPSARCNDGTGAMYFFRPASTVAGRDRWVIQLQGGGSCKTPDSCARRWCSVDTNFGMTQMTATLAPAQGTRADGILQRGGALGEPNPVGDWNHVFVRYCSSDEWSGTGGGIDVDAVHPVTAAPVTFRLEFNGGSIVDAVIATLRRDGATPPAYTIGGGSGDLPDLDDAELVLFAGASAGSGGVTHNGDRVRDTLRANNTACQGASCPLGFWVLHDSGTPPDLEALDFSTTTACVDFGLCDYETFITSTRPGMWGQRSDDSCRTWHTANDAADLFQCDDNDHVALHHVVSPMLIRMGLVDSLIGPNFVGAGYTVPGRGPLTIQLFGELVQTRMNTLPQRTGTAEEPAVRAPAAYATPCGKHEAISDNQAVFGVTVTADGAPRTMFDILANAFQNLSPDVAVWAQGDAVDCQ